MKCFALLLLFLLVASLAQATEYYLRADGSNANTGTSNTAGGAWLTTSYAVALLQPGDTLNVGTGTFGGFGSTPRHGTAMAPIVIQGAGYDSLVGFFGVNHDHWHIKNLRFWNGTLNIGSEDNSVNGNKATGLVANYCLVENCHFTTNNGYSKLSVGGNPPYYTGPVGTIIRGNTFYNHGLAGSELAYPAIGLSASSVTFENNTLQNSTFGGDAIHLFGQNNIIRQNQFLNWSYTGTDPAIHADLFQSYSTSGQLSHNHLIERNFAYNCQKMQLGNVDNVGNGLGGTARISNWTWRNNIWIRVTNPLNLFAPNFKFYNETFYRCGTNLASCIFMYVEDRGRSDGTQIRNCIFYKCGNNTADTTLGWYSFQRQSGLADWTGLVLNNNLVIGDGAGTTKGASWNWFNGNGTSLNGVDPLFIDPINADSVDDVRLSAGSPAIGFGTDLSANFTVDHENTTRGVPFDLGALEYAAGSTPTDTTPPTITSAVIDATGGQLTVNYSENVAGVASAHYVISDYSVTYMATAGSVATFSISPVIPDGPDPDLVYTGGSGRTADVAGNLLATVTVSATNNSLASTPSPPRPGFRGRNGSGTGARRR